MVFITLTKHNMKVTHKDIEYFINFHYNTEVHRGQFCKTTYCTITAYQGSVVGEGKAVCLPGDLFIKEKGRKWALKKALIQLFPYQFSKSIEHINARKAKTKFWESYFNRACVVSNSDMNLPVAESAPPDFPIPA